MIPGPVEVFVGILVAGLALTVLALVVVIVIRAVAIAWKGRR